MSAVELWTIGGPPILVGSTDSCHSLRTLLPPSGSVVVARLEGESLVEAHDVFEQFSNALSFPAYFGWNWDALSDCLCDLSWCPSDRYLVVIYHAEHMLVRSADEREVFLSVLLRAAHEWQNPLGKPAGKGVAFKVLPLCADESVKELREEVSHNSTSGTAGG
jgi:Barstar, RNAse (barnase) inhibitor